MQKPLIQISGLNKIYKIGSEKVVALDGVSLDIQRGEICCIIGTSGSGKSTLLNMIAGLEKPTSGSVVVNNVHVEKLNESKLALFRQKNLGFIFQSYNLLPTMTATENVAMPLMFSAVKQSVRDKKAKQMLKRVGLEHRLSHKPTQMSGGQQQRVAIARAFVSEPCLILADEPTGNLDSATTVEVMEMMVAMVRKNNQTMLIVTHEPELSVYADKVIHILDGKIDRITVNKKDETPKEN